MPFGHLFRVEPVRVESQRVRVVLLVTMDRKRRHVDLHALGDDHVRAGNFVVPECLPLQNGDRRVQTECF